MDEEQLHDFSNVLSQKLRQVKLAISKANLSQNKFAAFENEKEFCGGFLLDVDFRRVFKGFYEDVIR